MLGAVSNTLRRGSTARSFIVAAHVQHGPLIRVARKHVPAMTQAGPARPLSLRHRARPPVHARPSQSKAISAKGRFSGHAGLVLATGAVLLLASHLYAGPIHLEAPPSTTQRDQIATLANGEDASQGELVKEPATGQMLPRLLYPPPLSLGAPASSARPLELLGLGVRTVSFLRVRVYVAALYVEPEALQGVLHEQGWDRGTLSAAWFDAKKSEKGAAQHPTGEEVMARILDAGVPCAVRIVPVRSTDFHHLRDGFVRSLTARAASARKVGGLSPASDEAFSDGIQSLKDVMTGRGALKTGSSLDLVLTPSRPSMGQSGANPGGASAPLALSLEHANQVVGRVEAPGSVARSPADPKWSVARQLVLAYFADKDEISKPFKASVAEGLGRKCSAAL